jgi:3-dehydrosphinganine reductase
MMTPWVKSKFIGGNMASSHHFRNKVALVVGGSSGIGLATARLLAAQGAHVWLVARDSAKLDAALAQLESARVDAGSKFGIVSADVTDATQAAAAVSHIAECAGTPDLLINSAGAAYPGYFQSLDIDTFHRMMDLNYFGTIHVTKAVIPGMLQRGSGHIVNICSEAAFMGVYGYTAYGDAKYAVRGFSDALRAEMKPLGIGVSIVFPPNTDTPGFVTENLVKPPETRALEDTAKLMQPAEVASVILRGLARRQYIIIPGFEGKLFYWLSGLVGSGLYPIMDLMVAQARRKSGHK